MSQPSAPVAAATEKIAILDCGAQYTKVIDRRVREMRVATEIFSLDVDPALLKDFTGIIISGGPNSVYEKDAPQCQAGLFNLGVPVLGICYGMQLITQTLGGKVQPGSTKEYGETDITVTNENPLFSGLNQIQPVLMSHGDRVETLPDGFVPVGESPGNGAGRETIIAAMANEARKIYGVQFHPEVELTQNGCQMLHNFLYEVCGASGTFALENRLETAIAEIQQTVGSKEVFVLVSGGVDSSVTAALLVKALGPEKVYSVHIDSGFMRHNESDGVCEALKAIGLKHLRRIDAAEDFFNGTTEIDGETVGPLHSVTDPEQKRRIIGDVFYRLINRAMAEADFDLENAFIAQGTLRPDLIESGNRSISQSAHKIKTHHNDVPIIQEHRERGLIIEPNKDWHKDEVREVGRMLGLPEELVSRQPFPGPGLAIRILCAEQPYTTADNETISAQLKTRANAAGFESLLLPVQSVGVQGDGRTYSHLSVVAGDTWPDWPTLKTLAQEIPNHLHSINRVALCLNPTSLPESCDTITPTHLIPETAAKLRHLDNLVSEAFKTAGLFSQISQLLTVLVPVDLTGQGGHSIAIRAVITSDYMTARPAMVGSELPVDFLRQLGQTLGAEPGVNLVLYDLTGKPPATVEWE